MSTSEPRESASGTTATAAETVHSTYRRLRMAGLTAREAGSLTAHVSGLPGVPGGWAIEEVEGLLFVRALVRIGRIRS